MTEIAVSVKNVSKNFKLRQRETTVKSRFINLFRNQSHDHEQHALLNVSFEIKKGEFFGIVGRNGSGKSTMLKLLAGIYQPTSGKIEVIGRLVPFIELGVGFNPELSGRENVFLNGALLGFSRREIEKMYDEIVMFAELEGFMDQKLKNYSSGMQVRLAFAMAIRADADVLLVDEVLAVGDAEFQRKCFEYFRTLKKQKKTVVFVSHDMNSVKEYCDRALLLDESKVRKIGKPSIISAEYHKIFMDADDSTSDQEDPKKNDPTRWGNFAAKYSAVSAVLDEDFVKIKTTIKSSKKIDDIYFGVHILSSDGTEVTATNNRMIGKQDIKDVAEGESIDVEWRVLNIFNDGKYGVTLTMVDDAIGVIDWFEDAAKFSVKRMERSTTHVIPPTHLTVEKREKR